MAKSKDFSKGIKQETTKTFRKNFLDDPKNRMARNALSRSKLQDVALNWDSFREINHSFSHVVKKELKVTNQKKSGRCWLFAATNILRLKVANHYKLEEFELSQSYLYFWDKFEKANFFLESVIETKDEAFDSRIVMHIFSKPLDDGGQWHMFVSIVEKYGIVPQSVYPDSSGCFDSTEISKTIVEKLREFGSILRESKLNAAQLNSLKEKMMEEVYRMLSIHLGTPPTNFDWEFKNKEKKFTAFRDLTPKTFFKNHVKVNLNDYVCLVHSPRKTTPYYKTYTVDFLGNVVDGKEIFYVNVPIDVMKSACVKVLKEKEAIWFGCDVGKYLHQALGVMNEELFDYNLIYNTEFKMTKEERMNYGSSMMTHAMVFTGVNLVDGKPNRWRVENSWGDTTGEKGYYIMSDAWFDEYMFEVAIEKKDLPKKVLDLLGKKPIHLAPWDPLGSLAR